MTVVNCAATVARHEFMIDKKDQILSFAWLWFTAPIAAGFYLAGCASIVSGTTQEMVFRSTPENAAVVVDGREIGRTPLNVLLKKNAHSYVAFEKPGYKREVLPMTARLDGWFWGNIVLGGFFGSTTDGISGASHEYSPNQFLTTLQPADGGPMESKTRLGAKARAREFIVVAHKSIVQDLQLGEGEYLNSLMKVLEVPAAESVAASKRLKALSEAYPEIVDFADKAVEIYLGDPAVEPSGASAVEAVSKVETEFRELCAMKPELADAAVKRMPPARRAELTAHIFHTKGTALATEETFVPFPDLPAAENKCVDWYIRTFTEYGPVPAETSRVKKI